MNTTLPSSLVRLARSICQRSLCARFAALVLVLPVFAASAITIDDFNVNQATITGAGSSTVDNGAILGTERDLAVTVTSGSVSAGVSLGAFSFTLGAGANGSAVTTWDGNDNDAATLNFGLGANLTTGGDNAFILGVNSITGSPTITLDVFSSAANWSTFTLANPAITPTFVRIPHAAFGVGGGVGATFSSAAAIRLTVSGTAAATVKLDFLRTGSTTVPTPLEATLTDVVLVDNDANGKASAGDTLRYFVTISNTGGTTLSNANYSAAAVANASAPANLQISPLARDDGPTNGSAPGSPFHGAFNTTLNIAANAGLLTNDLVGIPAAMVSAFGGGGIGGTVDSNNSGTTAVNAGHSLTVNADGSLSFTPATGFTGPFSFQYRITNALGSSTATVTLAVGIRAMAVADARNVTGNVRINTANGGAFSVLDNDTGDAKAISTMASTSAQGGQVVGNLANGQFTYNPPPGFEGVDTFTYAVTNGFGSSNGIVTLTVSSMIWFVDASAGAGDGRLTSPFNTIAAFNASAHQAGDNIFLADGTYTGSLTLLNNEKLIGDGSSSTLAAITGITLAQHSDAFPLFSGVDPVISPASGHGINLASGNTIRGVTVGNTAAANFGYSGINSGTLTILESSKTGTGGGLSLSNATASITFDSLSSSSSTVVINLTNVAGTITINAGTITGPTANAVNIVGGTVSMTCNASITQASSAALVNISSHATGTITFQTGTLNATAGTGLQFDNADGTYNFNGTTTLNGGDAGIDILNGSAGTFTFGTGTSITRANGVSGAAFNLSSSDAGVTYSGSMTLGTTTGNMVAIDNHDAGTITFQTGNLTKGSSTTVGISIQNCGGGTINFNNPTIAITNTTANAVSLTGANAGGTINFAPAGGGNGLDLVTTSGTGFNATGGGTVTVTGAGNTITSTTGTALNVVSTTIGASGLTFQSISSSGGSATGIILDGTGLSGGLTVTGTGGAASGGTIANKTGADGATTTGIGIFLNNAVSISLTRMQLDDTENYGIRGTSVTNFTLLNTVVSGTNGNSEALNEAAVSFANLRGTNLILNSTISGGRENNLEVLNTDGTLNSLVVSNCIIQANQGLGNHGIFIDGSGTAKMTNTVFSCIFRTNRVQHYRANVLDTAIIDATIGGAGVLMNTMTSGHTNVLAADLLFSSDDSALLVFDCINNSINGALLSAIDVFAANTTAAGTRIAGTISGNTIGTTGVAGSGSLQASGVNVTATGLGTVNLAITGNTIRQCFETGMRFDAGDTSPVLNATITGNIIKEPSGGVSILNGIHVNMGTTAAGAVTACVNIGGAGALANDIVGAGGATADFRIRQRNSSTVRLPGYLGLSSDTAAVVAFVQAQNTGAETGSAAVSGLGGGFVGGAACTQP